MRHRRRHRRTRRASMAHNPRRHYRRHRARRTHARNPFRLRRHRRRHSFRSNPPDLLGFNLKDVAMAGVAVIAAPFVQKQIMGLLPVSLAGTTSGRWIVKVGSAAAIGYGAKKLLGPKAGNLAIIALGANLVADAVNEFAPTLTSGLSFYTPTSIGMGYYPRGMSGGPALRPMAGFGYTGLPGASLPGSAWGGGQVMNQLEDPFRPPF